MLVTLVNSNSSLFFGVEIFSRSYVWLRPKSLTFRICIWAPASQPLARPGLCLLGSALQLVFLNLVAYFWSAETFTFSQSIWLSALSGECAQHFLKKEILRKFTVRKWRNFLQTHASYSKADFKRAGMGELKGHFHLKRRELRYSLLLIFGESVNLRGKLKWKT